jgi:hypothetical protein
MTSFMSCLLFLTLLRYNGADMEEPGELSSFGSMVLPVWRERDKQSRGLARRKEPPS